MNMMLTEENGVYQFDCTKNFHPSAAVVASFATTDFITSENLHSTLLQVHARLTSLLL